ncbi:MAG: DUF3362 domain-containing protein, partial [Bacteroidales bacterium]|nr:DUF3362 domain-containing protein [Bacteroidales bacterium]
ITSLPNFSGHITDLGGPSANMYKMQGKDLKICEKCNRASCIFPNVCKNLNISHKELSELYEKVSKHPKVKKLSIGSGVRYDIALHKSDDNSANRDNLDYLRSLIKNYVSGRLKLAPEHTESKVLKLMRKTPYSQFEAFKVLFDKINNEEGRRYQLIPYFISSHPGCDIADMAKLAVKTKEQGFRLEQVQDFTPTPMTLSTVMFYTGINPYTGEKIYSANTIEKKRAQQKYFFWYKPENRGAIKKELERLGMSHLAKRLFMFRGGRKYN